jgi:hypothetical protein
VEAERRRALDAQRQALLREEESLEAAERRRALDAQRQALLREEESPEAAERRRTFNAQRQALLREEESPEAAERRRALDAQRQALLREEESPESAQRRRALDAQRQARTRFSNIEHFVSAGLNYSPGIDYAASAALDIGDMSVKCRYCDALKFKGEPDGMCCSGGKVLLPRLPIPPPTLQMLLYGQGDISKMFWKFIRQYNCMFQMTSFGATKIDRGRKIVVPQRLLLSQPSC